jgi:hypothetical protein
MQTPSTSAGTNRILFILSPRRENGTPARRNSDATAFSAGVSSTRGSNRRCGSSCIMMLSVSLSSVSSSSLMSDNTRCGFVGCCAVWDDLRNHVGRFRVACAEAVAARRRSTGEGGPEPVDGRMRRMVLSPSNARTSSAFLCLASCRARGRTPDEGARRTCGAASKLAVVGCGPVVARRSHDVALRVEPSCSEIASWVMAKDGAAMCHAPARTLARCPLCGKVVAFVVDGFRNKNVVASF